MHLTLKQETTRPAAANSLAKPARFDAFAADFNTVRPHEAPDMQTPPPATQPRRDASPACPSSPIPFHDLVLVASGNGAIGLHGRHVLISSVFAGQRLGLHEVDTDGWLVSFMHYDLGYIDPEARTPQTIDTPFGSRVSPM